MDHKEISCNINACNVESYYIMQDHLNTHQLLLYDLSHKRPTDFSQEFFRYKLDSQYNPQNLPYPV